MGCEGCYFGLLLGLCSCWALLKLVSFNFGYCEWWCHEYLNNSWDQKSFWFLLGADLKPFNGAGAVGTPQKSSPLQVQARCSPNSASVMMCPGPADWV